MMREKEKKNLVEIFLKYTINRLKICLRLDNQREKRKNNGINCLVVVVKRIIIVLKIFFFFLFSKPCMEFIYLYNIYKRENKIFIIV